MDLRTTRLQIAFRLILFFAAYSTISNCILYKFTKEKKKGKTNRNYLFKMPHNLDLGNIVGKFFIR